MAGSRVPLDQIKASPGGGYFPADPPVVVAEKQDGWTGRLDVGNTEMLADLAVHARPDADPTPTGASTPTLSGCCAGGWPTSSTPRTTPGWPAGTPDRIRRS